ncbi:MAG: signal peptide peptidase SppA [Coriobacteriia bacterium]|nr:signal peptide peptidase SppA [Coriobacteriia bacterium]
MTAPDDATTPNAPLPPMGPGPGPQPQQAAYPPYPPYSQPPHAGAPQPPYAAPTYGPQAYAQPGGDVPPAYPPSYAQPAPGMVGPAPARRSSLAWLWWLVGIAVVLIVIVSVVSLVSALGSGGRDGIGGGNNVIAVIPFDGTIAGSAGAGVITPESFLKLLDRADSDSNVKAIVVRVNSPGGTVAASEEIAAYVKDEITRKPVVISVGDVDASGAYMMSSQASKIVAGPGSAVGSIGVIMEIPNASALLGKVGVSFKVLTAGKYKDAGSPFRDLTPAETAMLQGQIDQVYGQFIDIVASGRKLPRAKVVSMATGWAWNGDEAKTMGLVDQIGTYKDALKTAAKLGGIKDGNYQEDVYNSTDSLGNLLSSLLGIESQLKAIAAASPANPASVGGTTLAK